jgi:hypothetical protein
VHRNSIRWWRCGKNESVKGLFTAELERLFSDVGGYNLTVEKTIRLFPNFEEADEGDTRAHANMSPAERLQLVIELRDRRHPMPLTKDLPGFVGLLNVNAVEDLAIRAFA